jgi:hypothetical protein
VNGAELLNFSRGISPKKPRKIPAFGFSLMPDGCFGLLQLIDIVIVATCAVFS